MMDRQEIFKILGLQTMQGNMTSTSPIDGLILGRVQAHTPQEVQRIIEKAVDSFREWRTVPAPKRGELIRLYADELRKNKEALGTLVTLENGKILQEGLGEVQEMIDICDYAVGLSRQLYGLTIASERPEHRMMETWHPLGPVGVITPFNFPAAVWSWNFALAIVCGDPVIWKPTEKTPLTALASANLFERAVKAYGKAPPNLLQVIFGTREVGQLLVDSPSIPLISATGSTKMGREVAEKVARRFGRSLLELSGNNAMILTPSADLNLALRAIAFASLGTAGQRCTTLRRLFVHESIYSKVVEHLKVIFDNAVVGNPLDSGTLIGPLIDKRSYDEMQNALKSAKEQGGHVHGGERVKLYTNGYYVRPALVEMPQQTEVVKTETFAPILYVMPYADFEKVLSDHNAVSQGLASCIFTNDVREAEIFLSARGSDCGIVNVNIGPSGAEIGGAFGGEKDTGGGRESGTDAWRNYMRRATNTINYSHELPLAQGIRFDIGDV
jgi:aldehyde dehydrogenase (NAD+)